MPASLYVERYDSRFWELDALSPTALSDRVEQAIVARLDRVAWERAEVTNAPNVNARDDLHAWPGAAGASSISGQASK
jgi:hypothetical protein